MRVVELLSNHDDISGNSHARHHRKHCVTATELLFIFWPTTQIFLEIIAPNNYIMRATLLI